MPTPPHIAPNCFHCRSPVGNSLPTLSLFSVLSIHPALRFENRSLPHGFPSHEVALYACCLYPFPPAIVLLQSPSGRPSITHSIALASLFHLLSTFPHAQRHDYLFTAAYPLSVTPLAPSQPVRVLRYTGYLYSPGCRNI
jgi:hypothetical protein